MKRVFFLATAAAALTACGGTSGTDGGADGGASDGGLTLTTFTAPSSTPVNNSFLVTVTGEAAVLDGFGFPAVGSEPYFVDGWEVTFERVLVTVARATISENPDLNPNSPDQTGPLVAEAAGPWAVDLAKGGPLDAKEGNGKALALARILNQNRKSGTPAFVPTDKYALGFELMVPSGEVQNVNLDAEDEAALRTMAEKGWAVWMKGTATWKGASGSPACRQTVAGYDFGRFPKAVAFSLGFKTPTTYKNCINPELQGTEERGIQSQSGAETVAQVTLHLDHPFWDALEEDAPLRFDALAALKSVASGEGPATATLTETDVAGLDFQAFKDAQGNAVPWRTCGPVLDNERTAGTVAYDPVNVPVSASGGAGGLKDLYDYMAYNLSTFGHLNNDGLCFPARSYASPP